MRKDATTRATQGTATGTNPGMESRISKVRGPGIRIAGLTVEVRPFPAPSSMLWTTGDRSNREASSVR